MIIIKLQGGIGNQLFQYSFGKFLMLKKGKNIKFDFFIEGKDTQREYKLGNFNTKVEFSTDKEIKDTKYRYGFFSKLSRIIKRKIFKNYNIGYSKKSLKIENGYFEGFWQSYRYLEPIQDILLKEITTKENIDEKYADLFSQINSSNSVSLHIRRGDYISNPKTKKMHNVFGMEYYVMSIDMIREKILNPTFFVFSDDIEWAKNNLKINSPVVFVSSPEIKDYEELIIMSKCKNNIIANSSFSWWSAWLNQNKDKLVIAPKKWFNNLSINIDDLIPENWLKI